MALSTAAKTALLNLLLNATPWANMADNAASSPLTNIYLALHTADPGVGGTQSTSEATYTGYARIPVVRTSSGWTVAGSAATNAAALLFGACTAGSNTITHASIGFLSAGAGALISSAALGGSISVAAGVTPAVAIGQLSFTLT